TARRRRHPARQPLRRPRRHAGTAGGVRVGDRPHEPLAGSAAVEAWLQYLRVERRRAANTVDSYARDLLHLQRFAAGREQPIETLDRAALEAFVRGLMGEGLSPRSVARVVS